MRDGWTGAQELFHAWPSLSPPDASAHGTVRRLSDAMAGLATGLAGWRDVAGLTRQVLLEAQARSNNFGLEVPTHPLLPSAAQWETTHCKTLPTVGALRVTAVPWHPDAPDNQARSAAEEDLRQVHLGSDSACRRDLEPCPADPFWMHALGYKQYISIGQRQAARAAVLAPPGTTTIVCLPTGHGKTAVILAPALLASRRSGVSVVVVPTTVLALDLERRTQELLASGGRRSPTGRYAYISGMPDDVKDQLRDDVRSGRQRMLFTSPEALITSLKRPVGDAAEAGLLKYLVIDEAHLVEQWGNGFRPEFQTMASQRRAWLRRSPAGREPITVAMSATLTEQQVGTLEMLFAEPSPAEIVWAAQLRHEPSYYVATRDNEEERQESVLQAVSLLPKPLALYVTRVRDADAWVDRLHAAGFLRVTSVTRASDDNDRREAVEGWGGTTAAGTVPTRYDIVVGTSAFGLGVDIRDVRTVVHSCLPETVDRYYQEIGRSGRDGAPSLAYLVSAPGDQATAESINNQAVITPERAWKRWTWMFDARERLGGDRYRVDLDAYPEDKQEATHWGRQWNIRVLNLMTRAELVRLHVSEPPEKQDDEQDDAWRERLGRFYLTIAARADVALLDSQVNDREHFQKRLAVKRTAILRDQKSALTHLRRALRGDRCIADVLSDYYCVPRAQGKLQVGVTCRGCPSCRTSGPPDASGFYRLASEPRPPVPVPRTRVEDPLARYRGDLPALSLWWRNDQERRDLVPQLMELLVRRGMAVVGGPGLDPHALAQLQREVAPHPVIADIDENLLDTFAGPVTWLLPDTAVPLTGGVVPRLEAPDVTYLLHPRTLEHPDRPGTLLVDVHRANIPIRAALEAL